MSSTRQARMQRAKRGVIFFVGLTLIVHIGLALAVGLSIRLRDPLYGDKSAKFRRRIAAEKPETTILAIGSSRLGMGFHGRLIERDIFERTGQKTIAFNFGIAGAGPISQLLYLQRLIEAKTKPDLLIVEFLPPLLFGGEGAPVERRSLEPEMVRGSELETLIRYGYNPEFCRRNWNETQFFPLNHLRYQLLGRVFPSLLPADRRFDWSRKCDLSGWNACPFTDIGPERRFEATKKQLDDYRPILKSFVLEGGPKDSFEEFLKLAKEQRIPTMVLWMPEGREFRALYREELTKRFENLLIDWQSRFGIVTINARLWAPDDEFIDSHHLMQIGARRFSEKLADEVLIPKLSQLDRRVSDAR